eukprot:gene36530-38686_t
MLDAFRRQQLRSLPEFRHINVNEVLGLKTRLQCKGTHGDNKSWACQLKEPVDGG